MATLFVSDLHLSEQRPGQFETFKKLMQGPAIRAEAFYILGDLFERFWIGCDDRRYPNQEIISLLREYTDRDATKLYVMRGNRDFHLNEAFAKATGCRLLEDPSAIEINHQKTLIMHGDTLCSDDIRYQRWARFITHPLIKKIYAMMPLSLRRRIAQDVQGYTAEAVQKKAPTITDVNQQTVIETMLAHEVRLLIHGHTHRQATHDFELGGKPALRVVLGDWYETDCVLVADKQGLRFDRAGDVNI